MDKYLKTILSNTLKHEAKHIMEHETNVDSKMEKMDIIFNMQKILDNYDELKPILAKFFDDKRNERWKNYER